LTDIRRSWRIPPAFTAALLAAHSALGLAFGAVIHLICITGAVSVLIDELKCLEQPDPKPEALRPGAIGRAVETVLHQWPRTQSLYAVAPITSHQRLTITAYGPGGEHDYLGSGAGTVAAEHTPFSDFVTSLHMTLTAPAPFGSLIVGLAGAALLALIFSGVLAHPRIFRDAFRLRLNGSVRLREADLHNRLSVWGLPFHVVVTLTGAFFGLANLAIITIAALGYHNDAAQVLAPITGPVVAADARPAPTPDLDALIRRAEASLPGSDLYYVALQAPGTKGMRIDVQVSAPGRLPRGEVIHYDAAGRPIGRTRFVTGALGLQAYAAAAQLHFGFFGGLPVKIIYVLLGATLSYVAATGVTIWLERRADRGRPSPRLRALWFGWTWGAPCALLIAAIAGKAVPPAWTFWICALAGPGVALWLGSSARLNSGGDTGRSAVGGRRGNRQHDRPGGPRA
jgi:uncharacterized iron-regulated membrane protein